MKLKLIARLFLLSLFLIALLYTTPVHSQISNVDVDPGGSERYSLNWNWSGSPADMYLIVYRQGSPETTLPVDGQIYTSGQAFGSGKVLIVMPGIASDNVSPIEGISFFRTTLTEDGTDYWFTIYPYYSSSSPTYLTSNPGEVAFITPGLVEEPMMQPSNASHSVGESDGTSRTITFSYDASPYELPMPYESKYLVVYKTGAPIAYVPTDGAPDVTFGTQTLSDGSKGRWDTGTQNETISVSTTGEEQRVYFKIFSFNKADFNYSIETRPSYNYLTTSPLSFTATIPAEENTAPVINDQNFTIIESIETGNEVGTITATDPQGDAITFAITDGNTNNAFTLNPTSGVLTLNDRSLLEFIPDSYYLLTVTASDNSGINSATVMITLNNAPVFEWTSTPVIFEGPENFNFVAPAPVSDPDGDDITLTITSGNDEGLLEVSSNPDHDYLIVIANGTGLDFETHPSITFTVEAEDSQGNITTTESITINVTNINDNMPTTENQTLDVLQNLPEGTLITTVAGSDADGDELAFFILSGNTDNAFAINETSGELTVNTSSALNFNVNPAFTLVVDVFDGDYAVQATIDIDLILNSAPVISEQVFELEENSQNGMVVGEIEATDNEGDNLTFSLISGNTNNAFIVVSSTGEILVTNEDALDFETNPIFNLSVSVSDGSLTEVGSVIINLTDVDETTLGVRSNSVPFSVYPNPSVSTISFNETLDFKKLSIRDLEGKLVDQLYKQPDNMYHIEHLQKGTYLIIIQSDTHTRHARLVVK